MGSEPSRYLDRVKSMCKGPVVVRVDEHISMGPEFVEEPWVG